MSTPAEVAHHLPERVKLGAGCKSLSASRNPEVKHALVRNVSPAGWQLPADWQFGDVHCGLATSEGHDLTGQLTPCFRLHSAGEATGPADVTVEFHRPVGARPENAENGLGHTETFLVIDIDVIAAVIPLARPELRIRLTLNRDVFLIVPSATLDLDSLPGEETPPSCHQAGNCQTVTTRSEPVGAVGASLS